MSINLKKIHYDLFCIVDNDNLYFKGINNQKHIETTYLEIYRKYKTEDKSIKAFKKYIYNYLYKGNKLKYLRRLKIAVLVKKGNTEFYNFGVRIALLKLKIFKYVIVFDRNETEQDIESEFYYYLSKNIERLEN